MRLTSLAQRALSRMLCDRLGSLSTALAAGCECWRWRPHKKHRSPVGRVCNHTRAWDVGSTLTLSSLVSVITLTAAILLTSQMK
jgi:hypothetical protein